MDTELKIKACVAIILAIGLKKKVKRTLWSKNWYLQRERYTHLNLMAEINVHGEMDDYENYFRMPDICFEELLTMVTPFLTKQDTVMRKAITPREKLALTMHYLSTGRDYKNVRFSAIMSLASISQAIMDTCEALIYVLRDYIKIPTTADEWKNITDDFATLHHFYNCIGAFDGKHIEIKHPHNSGSLYYNYKEYFSIVLMALVNAKKEFIMIDIGTNGRVTDGGVLFYTSFWELFEGNHLNLPPPSPLPNTTTSFPYIFVGDEAFALKPNLMKPYSQKSATAEQQMFNKRLSRARGTIECAFGILSSKFGVFQKPMSVSPDKATKITAACCYLHNYLIKKVSQIYQTSNSDDENTPLVELQRSTNRNANRNAKTIRDTFCHYYNNEGRLEYE